MLICSILLDILSVKIEFFLDIVNFYQEMSRCHMCTIITWDFHSVMSLWLSDVFLQEWQ